ncbi:MAG TPA: hypothetical protein VHS99_24825 [Chloroflexota bacterium]|nr:hypothetical protein [Chloroflexota bacterium]
MSRAAESDWIWRWYQQARAGDLAAVRTITLELLGAGSDPAAAAPHVTQRYTLLKAFPAKMELGGLKAGAGEVMLQIVTLQCDQILDDAP